MANRTAKKNTWVFFSCSSVAYNFNKRKKLNYDAVLQPQEFKFDFFLNFGICRKCKHCHLKNGKFWSDQIFEFLVNFRPGNVWIPFYTTVLPIYLSIGRTREVVMFRQGACQVACLSRAVNLDHLTIRTFSKARSAKRSHGTTEKSKGWNRTNHL